MRTTLGSTKHQKLLLPALVACAVLTIVASSPTLGETTIEPLTDRPGGDMKPGFEVENLEACRQACDKEKGSCRAYTLYYIHQTKPICWLKSSVPAAVKAECCTSGVRGGWRNGPYFIYTWGCDGCDDVIKRLDPASTHVCVMTRVSGKFMGGGERVRVYVGDDGYWYLRVGSKQDDGGDVRVAGTAYCFRKDGFLPKEPLPTTSPSFENTGQHLWVKTWLGDAATFLAGVEGHLRGGGEWVGVNQSISASEPSELGVVSEAGYLRAWAYSVFTGKGGSGLPAKFFKGEFKVSSPGSSTSVDMAPTDDAMCYFTYLSGKFDGAGEWAEIIPVLDSNGVERWRLRAQEKGDAKLWAQARCYLKDQRVFTPTP